MKTAKLENVADFTGTGFGKDAGALNRGQKIKHAF